jgi:hypothetical protein
VSRRVTAVVATHLAAAVLVAQRDTISLVSQQLAAAIAQTWHAPRSSAPWPGVALRRERVFRLLRDQVVTLLQASAPPSFVNCRKH